MILRSLLLVVALSACASAPPPPPEPNPADRMNAQHDAAMSRLRERAAEAPAPDGGAPPGAAGPQPK